VRYLGLPSFRPLDVYVEITHRERNNMGPPLPGSDHAVSELYDRYGSPEIRGGTLGRHGLSDGNVDGNKMLRLYKNRIQNPNARGRKFYDQLILRANKQCMLCQYGYADELDHYLPKGAYPELAVDTDNLIPCCGTCNRSKHDYIPLDANQALIHPYFDDLSNIRWLCASVVYSDDGVVFDFFVDTKCSDVNTVMRLQSHFDMFDLGRRYALLAADELRGIQSDLAGLYENGGEAEVASHLRSRAQSQLRAGFNRWQSAAYEAMASDTWFCEVGFRV
jgi:hypothetical protein